MYRELKPDLIVDTIDLLGRRIVERFPGAGLGKVAGELKHLAENSTAVIDSLRRPMWSLRVMGGAGIVAILGLVVGLIAVGAETGARIDGTAEFVQATESAVNDVILLGLAIFFLTSLETRVKRRNALRALQPLRSIVHVVDMHQLTKDPDSVLSPRDATASSPQRSFSRYELARYLDYCSEMLSLTSKVAALHAQHLHDPYVLSAVNDIETLAASFSNKIWQKIMILDTAAADLDGMRALDSMSAGIS